MVETIPPMTQFRVVPQSNQLVHLVFDCPGRSMNVFSNTAIHELGAFAEWLHRNPVRGIVVRSGKASGFCAGADLSELGIAYDMIVSAPPADRFDIAFDHFFPLSHAIRRLETAGVPVAAAIGGLALGGGCELALGCHYRAIANAPRARLGLPECAVGLLPGAGGTQRMPRLIGLDLGLEVLLQGRNLAGAAALEAGLVHELVDDGAEVAAAEDWLLSPAAHAVQPWDRPGSSPAIHADYAAAIALHRARELARMLGHEPAPLAILDCVEFGLMQPFDGAIRAEMSVFAQLIQRPEPRNMIRTMFLGKQAYDRADRSGETQSRVVALATRARDRIGELCGSFPGLARAGFGALPEKAEPVQNRVGEDFWICGHPELLDSLRGFAEQFASATRDLDEAERLQLDYLLAHERTIPAYLGGLSGLSVKLGVHQ